MSAEQIAANLGVTSAKLKPLLYALVVAAYTEQEHKDWLEEAGFGDFMRTTLEDGSSIIKARKINSRDAPEN